MSLIVLVLCLALAGVTTSSLIKGSDCSGYVQLGSQSNKEYYFEMKHLNNIADAFRFCANKDGMPVAVETEDELEAIKTYYQAISNQQGIKKFWTAGMLEEHDWVWLTRTAPIIDQLKSFTVLEPSPFDHTKSYAVLQLNSILPLLHARGSAEIVDATGVICERRIITKTHVGL